MIKIGYTVKAINNISESTVAAVSGTKPNFKIDFKKVGTFTADMVLEHPTKADITINNAAFEIK